MGQFLPPYSRRPLARVSSVDVSPWRARHPRKGNEGMWREGEIEGRGEAGEAAGEGSSEPKFGQVNPSGAK